MVTAIVWHGTPSESTVLAAAVAHNCACEYGLMGVRTVTCPVHAMMVGDQRALNGLVFMRREADRLRHQEFDS